MVRSRLRNKFLKLKTMESSIKYKKQRNFCVSLLRKTKNKFYENLNPNLITDNKNFWKQVKPSFSDKTPLNNNIILLEDNKIVSDNTACAEISNTFFNDLVKKLDINRELFSTEANMFDPVDNIIERFRNHPSILKIKAKCFQVDSFSFLVVSESDICRVIKNIDSSNAYQEDSIPPNILKENADVLSSFLKDDINLSFDKGKFPGNLKNADITPMFKKLDRNSKSNYRSVSILPTLSKIYKKLLYQQMYEYFENIFSKYSCGFRRGHSTQHCLLYMLEKFKKKARDMGLTTGILLTDLTKALDYISHELLIAKLNAYGFF